MIDPETDTTLVHHPLNPWMFKLPENDWLSEHPWAEGVAFEHEDYGWITRTGEWWQASTDAEIRQQGGVTYT